MSPRDQPECHTPQAPRQLGHGQTPPEEAPWAHPRSQPGHSEARPTRPFRRECTNLRAPSSWQRERCNANGGWHAGPRQEACWGAEAVLEKGLSKGGVRAVISVGGEHSSSSLPQPPPSSPHLAWASKRLQQGTQPSAQAGGKSPASGRALEHLCSRLISSPPLSVSRGHQAPPFPTDSCTVTPGNTCHSTGYVPCFIAQLQGRAARGRGRLGQ